jgi:hypothetical protein
VHLLGNIRRTHLVDLLRRGHHADDVMAAQAVAGRDSRARVEAASSPSSAISAEPPTAGQWLDRIGTGAPFVQP